MDKLDEIGPWSEIKLEIISKYARAYSKILHNSRLKHVYVGAFAGWGKHKSETTGKTVPGSPMLALQVIPPFHEYYFIDIKKIRVDALKEETLKNPAVKVFEGNCNEVLLKNVFPNIRYENYKRGLCLLDPYGLHLDWKVLETAGKMRSLEILLNFPIMDINRNALPKNPDNINPDGEARINTFWGDDSWRRAAYSNEGNLFGFNEKVEHIKVVDAFRKRLKDVAGFKYVPEPLAMKNKKNADLFYFFFASNNSEGDKIVRDVFKKYRN